MTGPSGAGTTTLGWALARAFGVPRFDSDFYFWTDSWPYRVKRAPRERDAMLLADLSAHDAWIESGSLDGWSEAIPALFDLVVYLYVPPAVRVERLRVREQARFAVAGTDRAKFERESAEFLDWARSYEAGDKGGRSQARHETWLAGLSCPVLRLEGAHSTDERVARVTAFCADACRPLG